MRTKLQICNKHKTYTNVGNEALAATRGDPPEASALQGGSSECPGGAAGASRHGLQRGRRRTVRIG